MGFTFVGLYQSSKEISRKNVPVENLGGTNDEFD
jgi:hypothetical protein